MTTILKPQMCRTTMQAYTRPLFWWTALLALSIAIIASHQYWIATELRANITSGGIGDPEYVFPRIRLAAYLLEAVLFLISAGGVVDALVKFTAAVHRRKRYSTEKRVLMPGRCS